MLSPQDIKNKTFNRAMLGYNMDEVNEYIDFICEKYESLCQEKNELQYKLNAAVDGLASPDKKEKDEVKQAIIIAKEKADQIIAEAEEKSRLLYRSAQESADKVLKDFRRQIEDEAKLLDYLKKHTAILKKQVIETYKQAIDEAERIAPDEKYKNETNIDLLVKTVLSGMKENISQNEEKKSDASDAEKRAKPTPVKGDAGKFKGRSIREKIKEINSRTADIEEPSPTGKLITDDGDKKES